MHYGMQRKERAGWSVCALCSYIQVCETVFLMVGSFFSPFLRETQKAGDRVNAHHDTTSNWMGCTVNTQRSLLCGQTTSMAAWCIVCKGCYSSEQKLIVAQTRFCYVDKNVTCGRQLGQNKKMKYGHSYLVCSWLKCIIAQVYF